MRDIYLFVSLVLTAMLLRYGLMEWVYTDDVYFYAFSETLSDERIGKLLKTRKEWAWLGFALTPFFYALKIFLASACLYCGLFFANVKSSFATLFSISLRAEYLFLLPIAMRLLWFTVIQTDYALSEISSFPPFSLRNLLGSETDEAWVVYPMRVVNLFELAYIFTLAASIAHHFQTGFLRALKLVTVSYGLGLLLWIIFVAFLLINQS
ncbi:hypothetical protein [Ohtaekwangia sp.]|uniref:hypothetical protein n=1 Tax=Ohtaekwangia sp. TaxID=2066019 RepID=UPI002F93814B